MEKKEILEALQKAKKESKERKFNQSIDFSIVFKELDLNKPEGKIDDFLTLPNKVSKPVKICALVDKELTTTAGELFDKVIAKDEFSKVAGKKRELKKLAREYDFFIAQANIMTDVAATFGKIFGPVGKMPNPKAGCIVTPKSDLESLKDRLQRTVGIKNRKQPVVSMRVGAEDMDEEKVISNTLTAYDFIKRKLPRAEQQIKKTYIKLTMGKPIKIGA